MYGSSGAWYGVVTEGTNQVATDGGCTRYTKGVAAKQCYVRSRSCWQQAYLMHTTAAISLTVELLAGHHAVHTGTYSADQSTGVDAQVV
jgi:hypothetical protein